MFWLSALLLAQMIECPLEPVLRLPPLGEDRPLTLQKGVAGKGFETWRGDLRGNAVSLTRRVKDGSVGLQIGGVVVELKPMGVVGVEGMAALAMSERGFSKMPVRLRVYRAALGYQANSVTIEASGGAFVAARCGGKLALFDLAGGPEKGQQGMDLNGDGKVDVSSPAEYSRVGGEAAVFGRLMLERVDWERRVLVMREVKSGLKLEVGELLTDFSYVDRLKVTKRLSENDGDYTLLCFWASWSGPSLGALPQLKLITEAFRVKILGLNGDEDRTVASKTLAQFEVLWPDVQSTEPEDLFAARLRVGAYPTYVLVDPSRKVVLKTESTIELIEEIRRVVKRRNLN